MGYTLVWRARGGAVVGALAYQTEVSGFKSRLGQLKICRQGQTGPGLIGSHRIWLTNERY